MPLSTSALARLQHQHETVYELIKGCSDEQLKHRINPEKWSVFENVAHITVYQPVFLQRVKLIEQTDNPLFERYVADQDGAFHNAMHSSVKELLDNLSTQRFIIYKQVGQLNETSLRRTGIHPKFGQLTLVQWTEFFLLHESHHLFTIFMLMSEMRKVMQQ